MEILPLVKSTSVIQDGFNALIKSVRNHPKILERTKHFYHSFTGIYIRDTGVGNLGVLEVP